MFLGSSSSSRQTISDPVSCVPVCTSGLVCLKMIFLLQNSGAKSLPFAPGQNCSPEGGEDAHGDHPQNTHHINPYISDSSCGCPGGRKRKKVAHRWRAPEPPERVYGLKTPKSLDLWRLVATGKRRGLGGDLFVLKMVYPTQETACVGFHQHELVVGLGTQRTVGWIGLLMSR